MLGRASVRCSTMAVLRSRGSPSPVASNRTARARGSRRGLTLAPGALPHQSDRTARRCAPTVTEAAVTATGPTATPTITPATSRMTSTPPTTTPPATADPSDHAPPASSRHSPRSGPRPTEAVSYIAVTGPRTDDASCAGSRKDQTVSSAAPDRVRRAPPVLPAHRATRTPYASWSSTTSRDLADMVATALRFDGCRTATAGDADEAMRVARELRPDIAVLDVMLPGQDGVSLLARLRAEHPGLPVVLLTARSETRDRVTGLRAGADDYVTKPFSLEELLARLQAVLRRTGRLDELRGRPARQRPDPRRAHPRGAPRRRPRRAHPDRVRPAALPDAQRAHRRVARRRSSTACGTTTSPAAATSSSSTSATCDARSTPTTSR